MTTLTATSWTLAGDGDATRTAGRYLLDVSEGTDAWRWEVWVRRPDGGADPFVASGSAPSQLDAMLAAESAATSDAVGSLRELGRWPPVGAA